jgi:hypothetical protein
MSVQLRVSIFPSHGELFTSAASAFGAGSHEQHAISSFHVILLFTGPSLFPFNFQRLLNGGRRREKVDTCYSSPLHPSPQGKSRRHAAGLSHPQHMQKAAWPCRRVKQETQHQYCKHKPRNQSWKRVDSQFLQVRASEDDVRNPQSAIDER